MTTTFHVDSSELDSAFLDKIKLVFGKKKLLITVEEDNDATEALLSSDSNKLKFRQSIDELNTGNLVAVSLDELRK
ncbi:MAG: hypothetical protein ABIX01_22305 [Chitinophagaceae bacterium]